LLYAAAIVATVVIVGWVMANPAEPIPPPQIRPSIHSPIVLAEPDYVTTPAPILWAEDAREPARLAVLHYSRTASISAANGPYTVATAPPPPAHINRNGSDNTHSGAVERWRPLVLKYFGPDHVEWALRIIRCESGGNPDPSRDDNHRGLFQHSLRYWDARAAKAGWAGADVHDPESNIAVSAWLFNGGAGKSHWTCKG
jgi:soluble lytic murein transglycosylase-like protein